MDSRTSLFENSAAEVWCGLSAGSRPLGDFRVSTDKSLLKAGCRLDSPPHKAGVSILIWLVLIFIAVAHASTPVRDSCTDDSTIVANVQPTDPIQIRHAVVGEANPCYSVLVTQAGKEVQGFVLGTTLPAVQEFERTRALESRVAVPIAPEAEKEKKPPLRPIGPPFQPWSGVDIRGKHLEIAGANSKVTLVTFWAIESGAARRFVENLKKTEAEFRPKGLRSFGLIEVGSMDRAKYYLEDMGLDSPQAYDRQGLAAKYNVDASKGITLVVDSSNNVVAITSNPVEIRAAVTRLLSSE